VLGGVNVLKFYCDGSSRIEDGERHGYIGIVGYRNSRMIAEHAATVGIATSNEAEYYAVITALVIAKRFGERFVQLVSDSQLVVRQLSGKYAIAEKRLARLAEVYHKLADDYDRVTVEHGTNTWSHFLAWSAKPISRLDSSANNASEPVLPPG
jgi:ribonuclease HI